VAAGKLFFHAKIKDKNEEEVTACDAQTGKIIWQARYPRAAFQSLYGNGPRATPAVVGDHVYTFGITGILTCFECSSGNIVWQVDTLKEFKTPNLFFGMSCSPLVEGDAILVNIGGKGHSIVAFDKNNGRVLWKALDDRASYSSPIVFGEGKERQVVFLTGEGLVSLNSSGELHWRVPLVDKLLESSATPARAGDVVVGSSITYGSIGVKLGSNDGKPSGKEIWKNEELTSYFSTPVAAGEDTLYMVTGTKPPSLSNTATLHCIDAKSGKVFWSKPKVGTYHASLLRTGDNKLLMLEEAGNLVLIDPDRKEYRELARANKVCGEAWAHAALANGKLYLRDPTGVVCLQIGGS
jgi:outer membrane protein assembly factor BamB